MLNRGSLSAPLCDLLAIFLASQLEKPLSPDHLPIGGESTGGGKLWTMERQEALQSLLHHTSRHVIRSHWRREGKELSGRLPGALLVPGATASGGWAARSLGVEIRLLVTVAIWALSSSALVSCHTIFIKSKQQTHITIDESSALKTG